MNFKVFSFWSNIHTNILLGVNVVCINSHNDYPLWLNIWTDIVVVSLKYSLLLTELSEFYDSILM